jgi:hypothetical protein
LSACTFPLWGYCISQAAVSFYDLNAAVVVAKGNFWALMLVILSVTVFLSAIANEWALGGCEVTISTWSFF